jgi:hypothetical protein
MEGPLATLKTLALAMMALPAAAQAWDVRLEWPFATGQNLPTAQIQGVATSGTLDTGKGFILTGSHRIMRMGPVLKFEWNAEWSHWRADGTLQQGTASPASRLKQDGLGLGVNAQFWVPFTGLAGELGLLERFHDYKFEAAGASESKTLVRPWLRAGMRWVLPVPGLSPYLAASFQQPLTKNRPVAQATASSLQAYLGAQNGGQEVQRLWTLGVGISF